jgi:hypothetical protein
LIQRFGHSFLPFFFFHVMVLRPSSDEPRELKHCRDRRWENIGRRQMHPEPPGIGRCQSWILHRFSLRLCVSVCVSNTWKKQLRRRISYHDKIGVRKKKKKQRQQKTATKSHIPLSHWHRSSESSSHHQDWHDSKTCSKVRTKEIHIIHRLFFFFLGPLCFFLSSFLPSFLPITSPHHCNQQQRKKNKNKTRAEESTVSSQLQRETDKERWRSRYNIICIKKTKTT